MKKNILNISFLFLSLHAMAQTTASFDDKAKAYIKQYGAWAVEEQQRVGIPASITLAQGIYETGAGESELATQANNHFGIKCKKEWQGETFAHTDDAPNECFRKYKTAKDSYKDHSDYLKSSVRYAELFDLDKSNYAAWAKGLKRCGYATNPAYAQKLIKMIEDYDLQSYTFAADGMRPEEVQAIQDAAAKEAAAVSVENAKEDEVISYNGIRAISCNKGATLLDKAMKYNIRYARLLEINELADEPLKSDMVIYLEPKKAKGAHPTYIVKEGETIETIAHKEGMNSRQLRIYNLMAQNEQPVVGSVLKLQEQSDERPATYKIVKNATVQTVPDVRLADPKQAVNTTDFLPTKKQPVQKSEEIEIGYGAEPPAELKAKMLAEAKAAQMATATAVQGTPAQSVKGSASVPLVQPVPSSQQAKVMAEKATPIAAVEQSGQTQATKPRSQVIQAAMARGQEQAKPAQEESKLKVAVQNQEPSAAVAPPAEPPFKTNGRSILESEIAAKNDAGDLPQTLEPEKAQQPQDEIAVLKAKLDKVVYARSSRSNVKVSSEDSSALYNVKSNANTATPKTATMVANTAVADAGAEYYMVQKGDTGYSIAKKYGIKVKQLNEWNNLDFEGIKVGQKLRVK